MRSDTDHTDPLAAAVRATLRDRAAEVVVDTAPFDPHHRPFASDALGDPVLATGPGALGGARARPALLVAAVVALLAGSAAAVAVVARDDGRPSRTETVGSSTPPTGPSPSTAPGGPERMATVVPHSLPAPPEAPLGMSLTSVVLGTESSPSGRSQLFALARDPFAKVLVSTVPGASTTDGSLTVRGVPAGVLPTKDLPDRVTTIGWQEGPAFEARVSGMTTADAVALLDSLRWRSSDHQGGFEVPEGSEFVLLGEAEASTAARPALTLRYRRGELPQEPGTSGVQRRLTIRTSVAVDGEPAMSGAYLATWLAGEQTTDGSTRSYDPTFGTFEVAWPDGRRAWLDAEGSPIDEQALMAIADGLVLIDGPTLLDRRAGVEGQAAAMPLLGAADLAAGRVEARGTSQVETLCLVVEGTAPRCTMPYEERPDVASFVIGGRWYVAAIGPDGLQVSRSGPELGLGRPVPQDVGRIDGRRAVLAVVPSDLTEVDVGTPEQRTVVRPPRF
jgi:hypothetical protein